MTGWSCSASLCYNNWRREKKTGVGYYRLPRDPKLQQEYKKVLKTDGVNWSSGYICKEHWSSGEKNGDSIPDIACPPSQVPLFEKKLANIKKKIRRSTNPSLADKNTLRELQCKLSTIRSLTNQSSSSSLLSTPPTSKPRPRVVRESPSSQASTPVRSRQLSKRELKAKLAKLTIEKDRLEQELHLANEKVKKLSTENFAQKVTINSLRRKIKKKDKDQDVVQLITSASLKSSRFTYENLKV